MVNKLQIVRGDNLSVQKVDLQIGDNIIGRGAATGNVDNATAEHAVTINVASTGHMEMTTMSVCYLKPSGSTRWQSLKVGSVVPISPGDACSILPGKCWFKVTSDSSATTMENSDLNGKRKATTSSEEEPPDKKPRSRDSVETVYSQSKNCLDSSDNEETLVDKGDNIITECIQSSTIPKDHSDLDSRTLSETGSVRDISVDRRDKTEADDGAKVVGDDRSPSVSEKLKDSSATNEIPSRDEAGKKIKWDCGRHFSDQTDQGDSETPHEEMSQNSEGVQQEDQRITGEATIVPDEPPRNKCAYGSRCYRRNSEHKRFFSHPGDSDYDVPDERPECPYGVRCYRKNPQHKRDFKHTRLRPSRAQTPIRGLMSDATSGTEQSSAEESADESDYEPSHYDGATSDEYRSDLDCLSDFDAISDCDDRE